MKKITKNKISYIIVFLVAICLTLVPIQVKAATTDNITSVVPEVKSGVVKVTGTTGTDVVAVLVEIFDKDNNLVTMETHKAADGKYEATIDATLTEGENYLFYVTNFNGKGEPMSAEYQVQKKAEDIPNAKPGTGTSSSDNSSSGSTSSNTTNTNTPVLVETVTVTEKTTTNKTTLPTKTPSKTEEKTDEKLVLPYQQAKEEPVSGTLQVSFGEGTIKVNVESQDEKGNTKGDGIIGVALGSFDNVLNAVLTEEEKNEVKAGNTVEVRLSMKKLTQEIPAAEKTAMEKLVAKKSSQISGLTIGTYMDISMEKKLGNKDWKKLTNLNEEVEITIDVPKDLQMDRAQYWVVKSHNGEVSLLEDLDKKKDTITIKSREFSTYAIAYAVSNVEDADGVESVENVSVEEVQTQEAGFAWYWWLLPVAVVVIAIVGYTVYKKNSSDEKHTK